MRKLTKSITLITCLDEDGNVLKRVTSGDSGDIEEDGGEHQSSENGGAENGGGGNQNENSGSDFPPEVDPSTDQPADD